MNDWLPPFLGFKEVDVNSDEVVLQEMEDALYLFYVRRFFSVFGRVPVVPRCL
jgi:hypothetical protein